MENKEDQKQQDSEVEKDDISQMLSCFDDCN